MSIQQNTEQMREKIALNPHLDAALNQAISDESQNAPVDPIQAQEEKAALDEQHAELLAWRKVIMKIVPVVEKVAPEFQVLVDREEWEELGDAIGEVALHYGLGSGVAFNHPLAKLAMAACPIGFAAYVVIQGRKAAAMQVEETTRPTITQSQEPTMQQTGQVASSAGVTVREMTADQPA